MVTFVLQRTDSVPPATPTPPPPMNNNDNKKIKLAQNPPSKVVHIRNIPSDVTETEIVHLGIPFGRVNNVLVLKGKNQAFLEMHDEAAAIAMVSYFTNCAAQLRGRSVYGKCLQHSLTFIQFKVKQKLPLIREYKMQNFSYSSVFYAYGVEDRFESFECKLRCSGKLKKINVYRRTQFNLTCYFFNQAALAAAQALTNSVHVGPGETQGGPNTVLRVIVDQMIYPVTLDVLYQIFSRVGKVLRIVTFTKGGLFQALIQYPDVVMAQAAKLVCQISFSTATST